MKNRTQHAWYNSSSTLILFFLKLILQFINRNLFISFLGVYYLGLSGVFNNILGILSLAELGIGTSIVFSLYKPVAKNKKGKILAYMNLYSKVYKIIAIIIFILGILVYPFLTFILRVSQIGFKESVIYFLFLFNSVIGYLLFSYKRSLLIAFQENYIISWLEFIVYFIVTIFQWITMWATHNYILVLIITICSTISSNLLVALVANNRHSLKKVTPEKLTDEELKLLRKNVMGNIFGNIAGAIVFGTDNILISSFINVETVGLYSNYTMITNAFMNLISQMMGSQMASVGNLIHTSNADRVYEVFKRYQFINFVISYMISMMIFILINPFITIWLGEKYLFTTKVVTLLSVYLFIQNYRNAGLIMYGAYGLYWESRYKAIMEAILNLFLSLLFLLCFEWGIEGILLGTIFSTFLTNTWAEPYIIFKYGLKRSIREYIRLNIQQWSCFFITLACLYLVLPKQLSSAIFLVWMLIAILSVPCLFTIVILFFCKNDTLRWWLKFIKNHKGKIWRF